MKKSMVNFELTEQQLKKEMSRVENARRRRTIFGRMMMFLLVAASISVLAATFWFPVFQITGNIMAPQLENGQVVLAYRAEILQEGDLVACYHENKIRIQRVTATPGDWIDIDEQGAVFVNDMIVTGKYIEESVLNTSTHTYPYQVPDGFYFVMSDREMTRIDPNELDSCYVSKEQIAGKILFRIWPLNRLEYLG